MPISPPLVSIIVLFVYYLARPLVRLPSENTEKQENRDIFTFIASPSFE
jgi:hypothetical protein